MESVAVIAGMVALVWGTVVFWRGGLVGGCLAVLLAGACFGVPFYRVQVGLVPLTVDRVLLVLLVVQYVVWRRWGLADPKPLGKPEILLLVFVGVLAASTFSHDWRIRNIDPPHQPYQPLSFLILSYLMPTVVYWIARQAKFAEREALAVFGGFAVFGVYLAITSLAESSEAWWLVFPSYIVPSAHETALEFIGRARGPLLHPVGNGILMSIALGGLLMWWPRFRRAGRAAILACVALVLVGIYLSLTRSAWMGGLLTLALVLALALPKTWRWPVVGSGLVAVVLVGTLQWEHLLAFKREKNLTARETAQSVELRGVLAQIAWRMFLDRPLFGCGYGQYENECLVYLSDRTTDVRLERGRGYSHHNVFLALLTETGLLGLALFVALLLFWTRDAWRLWRDADGPLWMRQQGLLFLIAVGVYVLNGMFHDVSVVTMMNMTFFFLAGVTAGLRKSQPLPLPQLSS